MPGADALELNIFFVVTDPLVSGEAVEQRYIGLVAAACKLATVRIAVKLGPYFSSLPHFASRLIDAGARGLVLFNRYFQPDLSTSELRTFPRLTLSTPRDVQPSLRWIGVLNGRVAGSLAASGGIHTADDAVKAILVGADAVMCASVLYEKGVHCLEQIVAGVASWLDANEFSSISQARGILSQLRCPDPSAFERANYTKALSSFVAGS